MFDTLKAWDANISAVFNFVNGAWLFVRLMPICYVFESTITYFYFKRIKKYASERDKLKGLRRFWKIMAVKLAVGTGLYWYALGYVDASYSPIILYRVVFYYLYTLVVVGVFVWYVIRIYSRFSKQPATAVQDTESGSEVSGQ